MSSLSWNRTFFSSLSFEPFASVLVFLSGEVGEGSVKSRAARLLGDLRGVLPDLWASCTA